MVTRWEIKADFGGGYLIGAGDTIGEAAESLVGMWRALVVDPIPRELLSLLGPLDQGER